MKNSYIKNCINAQGAVIDTHTHTHNCDIKKHWRWQKSLLLFAVFPFLGCFNLFAQSNTKPTSTEIIPCGGTTMSITDPVNPDNIPNTSPQVIQVCCPTGPASCSKRKISVCWHGLEGNADYKVGYLKGINFVNTATYHTFSTDAQKNNYLQTVTSSSLQTATANSNGDLCIDFCVSTTSECEYSFVIASSFFTPSWDNLFVGNFDSQNQGNPGFVLTSKQYVNSSFHGKSVKFIGSSGPCPPDPCECWF